MELERWVFQGDPSLSPLAASKEVHAISTWISQKTKDLLDNECKMRKLYRDPIDTESAILAEALDRFCVADYTHPVIKGKELEKNCEITFQLSPFEVQALWNIECDIIGCGNRTSIASIIDFALRSHITEILDELID